jgi:hypothetical protein
VNGAPEGRRPPRVRVTAPLNRTPVSDGVRRLPGGEAGQAEVGELFLRSLVRSQLRLALVVAGGFVLLLAGVPVLLAAFPGLAQLTVATVPLAWLLLGGAVYPLLIVCGALYVRGASRNEQRFRELFRER